jgi:hypothetical protein
MLLRMHASADVITAQAVEILLHHIYTPPTPTMLPARPW